jgi:hypothetical protein
MQTFIVRRRSGWGCMADLEKAGAVSKEVGDQQMADRVRWIRTYALKEDDGRVGTVCVYEATDAEALREHARRAGLPADEITLVAATLVIRPDPAAAGV